ncbi:hypothetical protein D3C78_1217410 [compost metagenome]
MQPRPSPADVARTVPPWASTSCRTSDRPMPRPSRLWLACCGAAWLNRSKMCSRLSWLRPTPWSITCRRAWSSSWLSTRRISLPAGLNFSALFSRFQMICSRRVTSPSITTGRLSAGSSRRTGQGCCSLTTTPWMPCRTASRSTGSVLSLSLPVRMRATSSRSSMIRAWLVTASQMVPTALLAALMFLSDGRRRRISALSWIRLSGCLSSWDMTAKNSSFMRLVFCVSANCLLRRSSPWRTRSSAAWLLLMSMKVSTVPSIFCSLER